MQTPRNTHELELLLGRRFATSLATIVSVFAEAGFRAGVIPLTQGDTTAEITGLALDVPLTADLLNLSVAIPNSSARRLIPVPILSSRTEDSLTVDLGGTVDGPGYKLVYFIWPPALATEVS